MRAALPLVLAASLPLSAMADPMTETVTPGNTLTEAPTEWLGETPHLVIMGSVNGYSFDLQMMELGSDPAVHATEVKREYLIDGEARPYQEFDTEVQMILDGLAKKIEFKLNHADFLTLGALPQTLTLVPEENPEGTLTFFEFEMEWESGGVSVNEEIGEWDGAATIAIDSAFGAEEPVADGLVGGFISASHGDETLVISYTFVVDEAEVEE